MSIETQEDLDSELVALRKELLGGLLVNWVLNLSFRPFSLFLNIINIKWLNFKGKKLVNTPTTTYYPIVSQENENIVTSKIKDVESSNNREEEDDLESLRLTALQAKRTKKTDADQLMGGIFKKNSNQKSTSILKQILDCLI